MHVPSHESERLTSEDLDRRHIVRLDRVSIGLDDTQNVLVDAEHEVGVAW